MNTDMQCTVNYEFLEKNWDAYNVFVLEGSTRSGKTIAIIQFLIMYALRHPDTTIRCCRFDGATHTETTILDMDTVLSPEIMGLPEHAYKKTIKPAKYTFHNGSTIAFSATNNIPKLHGMAQDILWLNEVMEINNAAYRQLSRRTKGKKIMDFNPSYNRHWVFDKVMGGYPKMPLPKGVCYSHSTYEDNPFLPDEQIQSIEEANPDDPDNVRRGTADQYEWDVYGLGKRGKLEGAVFDLWESTDWWPDDPKQCMRWGFGLDFGFTVDPTALVECVIHGYGLYVREHLYDKGVYITRNATKPMLPSIEGKLEEMGMEKDAMICADSANPEAIASLCNLGFNVCGVKKGKGSILEGINLMKQFKIHVHSDSQNLQNEIEHYQWKKQTYRDKEAQLIPEPIDRDNHLIDAVRYWCMMNLSGNTNSLKPNSNGKMNRSNKPKVKNRSRERRRR